MTDNPLPNGTRLLSVVKSFTFKKKLIQLCLKFQLDCNLERSISESFYSATNPALPGEKRYWLQRRHPAVCTVVFLLFLKVNTADAVCSNPGDVIAVLSTLDQSLIK